MVKRPENAQLRHRAEMPLLAVSALFTMLTLGVMLILTLSPQLQHDLDMGGAMEDISGPLVAAPFLPFIILFGKYLMAARARANGVKVGPDQFPLLHQRYLDLVQKLEMAHAPDLYVVNGNGVVNAYALSCNSRRKYIVIHAEIAWLLDRSPEVVDFVLAHELGHHKLKHVTLLRNLLLVIPNITVVLGKAAIRAQEYSADRVAISACGGCSQAIGLLAVGPHLQHQVNPEAHFQQALVEDRSWFIRMTHWVSDHAVNTKRLKAIRLIEQHGFDAHGDMFL